MPDPARKLHILYTQHAKELERFARQRVGGDDAQDVVHEAYLKVMNYADQGVIENPRAYLYRVTNNVANDREAKNRNRGQWTVETSDVHDVHCTQPGPAQRLEARDTLKRCLMALDELPEVCRHVFLLHRVDGLGQGEIAETLGIPKRTVERYIAKALAHCLAQR